MMLKTRGFCRHIVALVALLQLLLLAAGGGDVGDAAGGPAGHRVAAGVDHREVGLVGLEKRKKSTKNLH